jgi:hypothetical protein
MQWPSFANISNPWNDNLHDFTAPNTTESTQVTLVMIKTTPSSDPYWGFSQDGQLHTFFVHG